MLKGSIPTLDDPVDVPSLSPLEGFGRLEIGLTLDQFSMQLTSVFAGSDADIYAQLDLASLPGAIDTIKSFGASGKGMKVEYQGVRGYDPERIRQTVLLSCCPQDFNEPPSKIFHAHNMGEYGSGGLPEFLYPFLVRDRFNSARLIDSESLQYAQRLESYLNMEEFRRFKDRFGKCDDLARCRAARSIQVCWNVSTIMDRHWGDWLLKVAVHAACTMERAQRGDLTASQTTITLLQLSRELGYGLQNMLCAASASPKMAAVASLLIEAGFGFISAGLYQMFTQQQDTEYALLLFGLAEHCGCIQNTAARSTPNKTPWMELTKVCIDLSNFCPSRANMVLELHPIIMFHLIARCNHIPTHRELHKTCDDSCSKAYSTENHQQPGHLHEGCECEEAYFKPMETAKLVLFDTEEKELFEPKSKTPYVAVSQIWFQGIFGQDSRRCGECSLSYLAEACNRLGVRYAWIDTLCMPRSPKLRDEVVAQLRDIYLHASATLVVDAGLISTVARTVMDLSFAILLSDWSSRIWTLQEGVLASKLLFCVGKKKELEVLALPQAYGPDMLLDTRNRVPYMLLQGYGMRERGVDQPLENVVKLAVGRQTSHPCDNLYGLSALLPLPPKREDDLHLVAREVARMYTDVDLGILLAPFPRCGIEGYRWMPRRAQLTRGGSHTGLRGVISPTGLLCEVNAFIKLISVVDDHTMGKRMLGFGLVVEKDIPVKFWYSTETQGVFVGTDVEASHLIFCLVGHTDDDRSYGFVVSPTDHGRNFQYMGCAGLVGRVPEMSQEILVT
ncbi:hypothetical protein EDD21DRAFT_360869 [Dissophora ornata]|nr:hypothetical protein EDD21DRAFT_360869 [Dissophora ornata]